MIHLNGGGDWVDVDQLLHISLICVPQVVLAGHAKYLNEYNQKSVFAYEKENEFDTLTNIFTCHMRSHHCLQGDNSHLWQCTGKRPQSADLFEFLIKRIYVSSYGNIYLDLTMVVIHKPVHVR